MWLRALMPVRGLVGSAYTERLERAPLPLSLPKTLRGSARLCTTGILAQERAPAVRRTQTASPELACSDNPIELYAARE